MAQPAIENLDISCNIAYRLLPASVTAMIDRFLFDKRIENMGRRDMLAIDHIPTYRPFFGKLVQRIIRSSECADWSGHVTALTCQKIY